MAKDNDNKQPEQAPENVPEQGMAGEVQDGASVEEALFQQIVENRYVRMRHVQIELKKGYILRKVGQAYMVMPTGPRMKDYQGMITLNETGAFLFKELEKGEASEETLAEACIKEYDATPEEAQKAVDLFIQQCADCGLMEYEEAILDKETGNIVTEEEINEQQNQ